MGEEVKATGIVIQVSARVWFKGVNHVRELYRIANKERREVITDQVPVTFGGVELGGEAAWITQGFRRMVTVNDRRKPHKYRRGFTGGKYLGLGQVAEVVGDGERTVGAGASGMYNTLRNTLTIKALQFLDQLHVLQQDRAIGPGGLRILIVANRCAIIAGEVGGVYGQRKKTGAHYKQHLSRRNRPAANRVFHRGILWFF